MFSSQSGGIIYFGKRNFGYLQYFNFLDVFSVFGSVKNKYNRLILSNHFKKIFYSLDGNAILFEKIYGKNSESSMGKVD